MAHSSAPTRGDTTRRIACVAPRPGRIVTAIPTPGSVDPSGLRHPGLRSKVPSGLKNCPLPLRPFAPSPLSPSPSVPPPLRPFAPLPLRPFALYNPRMLNPDRYFDPDPTIRSMARRLYRKVEHLPLVCPHGHVDPRLLADNTPFPDPAELIIIPDHYIFRMFYSQGIPLETLGVPKKDGGPVETDHRKIWQIFGDQLPGCSAARRPAAGSRRSLREVFGIDEPLNSKSAMGIYDRIAEKLAQPEFLPRALFEQVQYRNAGHDGCGASDRWNITGRSGVRLERPGAARPSGRTKQSTSCSRDGTRRSSGLARQPVGRS